MEAHVAQRFFKDLSSTLDVGATARRLGITLDDARKILRGAAGENGAGGAAHEPAAEKELSDAVSAGLEIYVDGASRGNPGRAGAGAVITSGGAVVKRLRRYLGTATNNAAEYEALIMALEEARALGARRIKVFADSELMVRQINGLYKVRSPELLPRFLKAAGLLKCFAESVVVHVYREENKAADRLANEAIDNAR